MIRFLLAAALTWPIVAQDVPPPVIGVGSFVHVVADVDRSLKFYVGAMGLDW